MAELPLWAGVAQAQLMPLACLVARPDGRPSGALLLLPHHKGGSRCRWSLGRGSCGEGPPCH